MKKGLLGLILFVFVFAAAGCGEQSTPENAVGGFFEGMKAFDMEAVKANLVPPEDAVQTEIDEFVTMSEEPFAATFLAYLKGNASKLEYHITGSQMDGDTAVVTVHCTYVDGSALYKAVFQDYIVEAFTSAFSGKEMTEEETVEMLAAIFDDNVSDTVEAFSDKTLEISCVKVEDTWYVETVDENLGDVLTGNLISAAGDLGTMFGE